MLTLLTDHLEDETQDVNRFAFKTIDMVFATIPKAIPALST